MSFLKEGLRRERGKAGKDTPNGLEGAGGYAAWPGSRAESVSWGPPQGVNSDPPSQEPRTEDVLAVADGLSPAC